MSLSLSFFQAKKIFLSANRILALNEKKVKETNSRLSLFSGCFALIAPKRLEEDLSLQCILSEQMAIDHVEKITAIRLPNKLGMNNNNPGARKLEMQTKGRKMQARR